MTTTQRKRCGRVAVLAPHQWSRQLRLDLRRERRRRNHHRHHLRRMRRQTWWCRHPYRLVSRRHRLLQARPTHPCRYDHRGHLPLPRGRAMALLCRQGPRLRSPHQRQRTNSNLRRDRSFVIVGASFGGYCGSFGIFLRSSILRFSCSPIGQSKCQKTVATCSCINHCRFLTAFVCLNSPILTPPPTRQRVQAVRTSIQRRRCRLVAAHRRWCREGDHPPPSRSK
jgi:hypothetical protein